MHNPVKYLKGKLQAYQQIVARKKMYNSVFSTPAGREVLLDLMAMAKMNKVIAPDDPNRERYEGVKGIVIFITETLKLETADLLKEIEKLQQKEQENRSKYALEE